MECIPRQSKKDIRKRRFEENDQMQNYKIVRKYFIDGEVFNTFEDAAKTLGITVVALKGRYNTKNNPDKYTYTYLKEDI